jgi:hypothetical protein
MTKTSRDNAAALKDTNVNNGKKRMHKDDDDDKPKDKCLKKTTTSKFRFHRYLAFDEDGKEHRESVHNTLEGAVKAALSFLMLDELFWPDDEATKNKDYQEYYMDDAGWIPCNWCNQEAEPRDFQLLSFEEITQVIRTEVLQTGTRSYRCDGSDAGKSYFEITSVVVDE